MGLFNPDFGNMYRPNNWKEHWLIQNWTTSKTNSPPHSPSRFFYWMTCVFHLVTTEALPKKHQNANNFLQNVVLQIVAKMKDVYQDNEETNRGEGNSHNTRSHNTKCVKQPSQDRIFSWEWISKEDVFESTTVLIFRQCQYLWTCARENNRKHIYSWNMLKQPKFYIKPAMWLHQPSCRETTAYIPTHV